MNRGSRLARWFGGALLWACVAAGVVWRLPASPDPEARLTPTVQAVEKAMPSVVNIGTQTLVDVRDPWDELMEHYYGPYYRSRKPDQQVQYELGSGVIIDEDGFILTNDHVVRRADHVWVRLTNGKQYEADVMVNDSQSDVALLKLRSAEGEKFQAIGFAQPDDLLLGETVIALGNPFGLGGSVSRGILSSKNRRLPVEGEKLDVPDWLQVDAAINPGNSGGPLINLAGELIGLNVAMVQSGQGIGFAIPIKQVNRSLSNTLTPEVLAGLWFGARLNAGSLPLQVLTVEPDSPADQGGLKVGDEVITVKGQSPRNFIEFNRLLMHGPENNPVEIQVRRGVLEKTAKVQLIPETEYFNADLIRKKLGLNMQVLTRELAQAMDMSPLVSYGRFLVSGVDPDSAAAKAKLQPGLVIRSIDGQVLDDITTAAREIHTKGKGDKVSLGVLYVNRNGFFSSPGELKVELTLE